MNYKLTGVSESGKLLDGIHMMVLKEESIRRNVQNFGGTAHALA